MSRILVTGMGLISSIGENVAENHLALKAGKSGITKLGLFPSRYSGILPCGEIIKSSAEFREKLGVHEPGATRTSLLAKQAFDEAVADSGLSPEIISDSATALVAATTVGGMCLTDELYRDAHADKGNSPYLSSYDCGSVALFLQKHFHMNGIIDTINTACSSSANAILYGAKLIRHGRARRAIVGGVDSLAKFTLNGFNSLHILSQETCKPFDQDRQGLNLGEGAAFIVLESEEDLGNRKAHAKFAGYGNANDSFHPSSLSEAGDGPYLSMKQALETAGLLPESIDFINAHGTGTENNDLSESRAMIRLFQQLPAFGSTKSNTGHTLGGAGAIEAVFAILNLRFQEAYANLQFRTPIADTGLIPLKHYQQMRIEHVMSNSFGFGGNCTSLIFSKS